MYKHNINWRAERERETDVGEKMREGKEEREDVREWREGGKERWSWRGERGKTIYFTRCIDFIVDGDF